MAGQSGHDGFFHVGSLLWWRFDRCGSGLLATETHGLGRVRVRLPSGRLRSGPGATAPAQRADRAPGLAKFTSRAIQA